MISFLKIPGHVPYEGTVYSMRMHAESVLYGKRCEEVWLLEHAPVYTIGRRTLEIPHHANVPVIHTKRGGEATYHGPGQRIGYTILSLTQRKISIHTYLSLLSSWLMETLQKVGIAAHIRKDFPGLWVGNKKIASIGVHVRRGIVTHGFALNVSVDLSFFRIISACGLPGSVMTSIHTLKEGISLDEVDHALITTCPF